ncbi:MAG: hypothetical protein WDO14_05405 [Bacteroidota bacterium]
MVTRSVEDISSRVSQVSRALWELELEEVSWKYVALTCWAAAIFDPVFAFTDYLNIPEHWQSLFIARLLVAAITLTVLYTRQYFRLSAAAIMFVPFFLISIQNAVVYKFIGPEHALAQNLNYMALMIGASLFVLWNWTYSVFMVLIGGAVTAFFLSQNPLLTADKFFLNGGLLLASSGAFMVILINARYKLTIKEIKARLALADSISILQSQAEEIKSINENLERLVIDRTSELEAKNKAIEEYTFITAHRLRAHSMRSWGLCFVQLKRDSRSESASGKFFLSSKP